MNEEEDLEELGLEAPLRVEEEVVEEHVDVPEKTFDRIRDLQDMKTLYSNSKNEATLFKLKERMEKVYPKLPEEKRTDVSLKKSYKQLFGRVIEDLKKTQSHRDLRIKLNR